MGIPVNVAFIGIGRQSAKGVGAPATFGFGVKGGVTTDWNISQAVLEITNQNPGFDTSERKSVVPGAKFQTMAYSQLAGLLLYGLLGNDVVTGTTPKIHTITAANDPIPYFTVYTRYNNDYAAVLDCKIDELVWTFAGAGNLDVQATLIGTTPFLNQGQRAPTDIVTTSASPNITSASTAKFTQADVGRAITGTGIPANACIGSVTDSGHAILGSLSAPATPVNATTSGTITATIAPWAPITDLSGTAYFSSGGGTFQMDGASNTPVAAKLKSGKVDMKRNLGSVLLAATVFPDDIVAGQPTIAVDLTTVPADLSQLYEALTGNSSGTAISQTPQQGSADLLWTYDANTSLEFTLAKVVFSVAWPSAQPKGGQAAELLFTGDALRGASNICTAIVHNTVAAY